MKLNKNIVNKTHRFKTTDQNLEQNKQSAQSSQNFAAVSRLNRHHRLTTLARRNAIRTLSRRHRWIRTTVNRKKRTELRRSLGC